MQEIESSLGKCNYGFVTVTVVFLYGCGLIHVCVKTYAIKLYQSLYSWN